MTEFFVRLYRLLQNHRLWMWIVLLGTSLLFAFFAVRLHLEEDISKLLPKTDKAEKCSLAFEQLAIKDKLFIQIRCTNGSPDLEQLCQWTDEFAEDLRSADSASGWISHLFYRMEEEWKLNGMDYALGHLPCFLDTNVYTGFDSLLQDAALRQRMTQNAEIFDNDMDGTLSSLLCYDPAGLRFALLNSLKEMGNGAGGFALLNGHLMTPDSTTSLIFVTPTYPSSNSKASGDLVKTVKRTAASFSRTHPEAEVLYHGSIALSAGNSGRIKTDLLITVGISLLLIMTIVCICMGHRSTLPLLLFPVLYGTVAAMAGIYWIKGSMSLMALGLSALVLGIALSYTLHVLVHHKYLNQAEQVVKEQAEPLCLSCLTTMGALLSLMFTRSELLGDFGLFASLALLGTTLCALVFMPQFLHDSNSRKNEKAFALMDKINSYPLDKKTGVIIGMILLCAVCFFASRHVKFDNDLNNLGYSPQTVSRSLECYNQKVNQGYQCVYYASTSKQVENAMKTNRQLSAILDSLQQNGLVKRHSDISSFCLTLDEQQDRIRAWKAYWTPERIRRTHQSIDAAARQNGLEPDVFDPFYALLEADYEPEILLTSEAVPYEISSNFMEKINDEYLIFTSALVEAGTADSLSDIVSTYPGIIVANPYYYTDDMVSIVHKSFITIMLISSLFVLLVLLISFRSITTAILAFLPMFLSWYVVQGLMFLFGIEFNLINIILSSFIFGVGVDYSIFTIKGLLSASDGEDAQLLSHHRTAILLSALMLIIVAASLLVAVHPSIHSVGICTLIGMTTAILFSYSIQPWLFRQLLKIDFIKKHMLKS